MDIAEFASAGRVFGIQGSRVADTSILAYHDCQCHLRYKILRFMQAFRVDRWSGSRVVLLGGGGHGLKMASCWQVGLSPRRQREQSNHSEAHPTTLTGPTF